MAQEIIDGRKIAADIREEIKTRIASLNEKGVTPGLAAVVIVLLLFACLYSELPSSVDNPYPAMLSSVTLILVGIWFLAELLFDVPL